MLERQCHLCCCCCCCCLIKDVQERFLLLFLVLVFFIAITGVFLCAGFWTTSGCIIYCQTLQHEQKQSGQPVLQRGSGGLHLHSLKTLPEFEAHRLWSSGNCLVCIQIYVLFMQSLSVWCAVIWFTCFYDAFTVHWKCDTGLIPIWSLNAVLLKKKIQSQSQRLDWNIDKTRIFEGFGI